MTYRVKSCNDFDPFAPSGDEQIPGSSSSEPNGRQRGAGAQLIKSDLQDEEITDRRRTRAKAFSLSSSMVNGGSMVCCYALRLRPGEELRKTLLQFVESKHLKAAFIMSCVGSVQNAKIRLASATSGDTNYVLDLVGPHEIVSLTGTLSDGGHMHVSLADQSGKVRGGHLLELTVMTTIEIVIGECSSLVFKREPDDVTGFNELVITDR